MQIWICFAAVAFIVMFLLYIPDMFPKCSCCGKKKFKAFFRIHRVVGINPGYSGSRSVCSKCCLEFSIEDLDDLDRLMDIRRKMKLDSLTK